MSIFTCIHFYITKLMNKTHILYIYVYIYIYIERERERVREGVQGLYVE